MLTTEYDLSNADARLLSLSTTIGAYQARIQKQKSILNRIHRAKRGIPTAGKVIFGRRFVVNADGSVTWSVDEEIRAKIEQIAERYLLGESLRKLTQEFRLCEHTTLLKNLKERCGTDWTNSFAVSELNIKETVTFKVPRLLPDAIIQKIRQRTKSNRTFTHGQAENKYLLGRMVFCDHCGTTLTGQTRPNGTQYYRHKVASTIPCSIRMMSVRAMVLIENVVHHLFDVFGNPMAVQTAIEEANIGTEQISKLIENRERIETELKAIDRARNRILDLIRDDCISDAQARGKLKELNEQSAKFEQNLNEIEHRLKDVPNPDTVRAVSSAIAERFKHAIFPTRRYERGIGPVEDANGRLSAKLWAQLEVADGEPESMSWAEKRYLLQMVFGGHTSDSAWACTSDGSVTAVKHRNGSIRYAATSPKNVGGPEAMTSFG